MERPFRYTVDAAGPRLDVFLAKASGTSREFVQEQIEAGRVLVDGAPAVKASRKLRAGEVVSGVFVEDTETDLVPVARPLHVLHEDADFLVLNKEQGVVVHPATGHRGETLVHYLLHHLARAESFRDLSPTRPGIVHRLDRGTSGILLIAKNRAAQERLSAQFKARQVKKEYEAVVWNVPRFPSGTFDSPLGRDRKDRKRMSSKSAEPRAALTRWRRAETFAHFCHVALFPETGRTHQLRVHLCEAGHPIVGDDLYGLRTQGRRDGLSPAIRAALDATTQTYLHARRLELDHPRTGERLAFEAPRPENFERFLHLLRQEDR